MGKDLIPLVQKALINPSGTPGDTREDIRRKKKDLFKALFGDILPEIVDEELKLREERKQAQQKIDEDARIQESLKWMEDYQIQQEDLRRNPYLRMNEVTRILGISAQTVCRLTKLGKIKGKYEAGWGWFFRQDDILDVKSNLTKIVDWRAKKAAVTSEFRKNLNRLALLDKEDTYMTLAQLEQRGIIPVSASTVRNWIKKGSIRYKTIKKNMGDEERIVYYVGVNYLKELFANPPPWLARNMKISKGCRATETTD